MNTVLRRLIDLGIGTNQPPAERRRLQTINVVALLAIGFNIAYLISFASIDFAAFAPSLITGSLSVLGYLAALGANARHRHGVALALMFVTGPFNLTFVGVYFGFGTGGFLYLLVLPVTAILMTPAGNWWLQMALVSIGSTAFVAVAVARPDTHEAIEGTALETGFLVANTIGTAVFIAVVGVYFRRVADAAETGLLVANERSERLLLNILPAEIAERLKDGEEPIADRVEHATVLFADLVGSTPLSELLTADEMVEVLNGIFTPFDDLADGMGLEKIKTVGDAYMVVGGLPTPRPDHVAAVADMAIAMRRELEHHVIPGFGPLEMRFGIHTGPVVAGVIGKRKFSYDLWGDTVNTAARMESHGVAGRIHVTEEVATALSSEFEVVSRGEIDVKGKGIMRTHFLQGRKTAPRPSPGRGAVT